MAAGKDVKAGGAWVEIFADNSPLRRTLKSSAKLLSSFAQPVLAASKYLAGGFAIASTAALAATKKFADYSDQIADMSSRTGVSVKALSELGYAAKMSGSELSALEPAIRTMQKGIVSGSATGILEKLGLDRQTIAKMNPEDQFLAIADKLSGITDPAQQAAYAMQIFGKSGTQLLGMMKDGSAGIEAMRQEARDLGVSLSDDAAAKAGAFNDALDKIMMAGQGVANVIGAALAPALTWLAEAVAKQAASFGKWLASVLEFVGSYENAMATLKLIWVTVTANLEGVWDTVISNLAPPFVTAFEYIAGFFDNVITGMLIAFENVAAGMKVIAHEIADDVAAAFQDALGKVRGLIKDLGEMIPVLKDLTDVAQGALIASSVGSGIAAKNVKDATANAMQERDKRVGELNKGLEQRGALRQNAIDTIGDNSIQARRQARQAEIDRATQELNATMQKTREAAAQAAANDAQAKAAREAGFGAYAKSGGPETAGTFNAAAIFGLGASSVQEDILKATQDVADGIQELNDLVGAGGMA
jgi:hypothetical protein